MSLVKLAIHTIEQMTGRTVPYEDRCEAQGDSDYQIMMYALIKAYEQGCEVGYFQRAADEAYEEYLNEIKND